MIRLSGSIDGAQVISRYISNLNQYSHNIILPTEGGYQLHNNELDSKIYPTVGDIANFSPCLEGFVPYVLTPEQGVRLITLINQIRSKNIPVPVLDTGCPEQEQLYEFDEVLYENAEWTNEVDFEVTQKKIDPIMKEILFTERDYVTDLNILVRVMPFFFNHFNHFKPSSF